MIPSLMEKIQIRGRWREELEATSAEGKLIFEFMMGKEHVYFPSEAQWVELVPAWAKEKWQEYHDAVQAWCMKSRIPLSIVSDTHVYEEK